MRSRVYLESFLEPLEPFLARDDVTDIYVNRPLEIWTETLGGETQRYDCLALTEPVLMRLARQIAATSAQGISREHPLLAASLPDGTRVQIISPPATRGSLVMAIRKHVAAKLTLEDYAAAGAYDNLTEGTSDLLSSIDFVKLGNVEALTVLRDAVRARHNIMVSGGTSSGKTTFLNALLREIPKSERLIVIEDTPELDLIHANAVGLLAARSALSEASLTAEDLLVAALRMRPDRIILGELRGKEAFAFLRSVNTGHPGSMTTIHANSPLRAIEQLALLVLQSGARLHWEDVLNYARASIDVFVHLERIAGKRCIAEIMVRR
jgi:type IV secretion system protein VirB11